MGLKKFLDAGRMVMGSSLDAKLKPLSSMDVTSQQRQGYADKNGNWTDRGFDRATSTDYQGLERSRQATIRTKK